MPTHYTHFLDETSQTGSAYNDKYHKTKAKAGKHNEMSSTKDTDHGGVAVRKRDAYGYYGNNGGFSTYLAGHDRGAYTEKKRAFISYDDHHKLAFEDPKEEVDKAEEMSKGTPGGAADLTVAPPVVNELSIDNRSREQQRLVGLVQKKTGGMV